MTKLTIQLDWKEYWISGNDQHPYFDLETLIKKYLFAWLLVELQPQEEKISVTDIKIENNKSVSSNFNNPNYIPRIDVEMPQEEKTEENTWWEKWESCISKNRSILQKLRAELERREKEHRDCEEVLSEFWLWAWQCECELLSLLNELEETVYDDSWRLWVGNAPVVEKETQQPIQFKTAEPKYLWKRINSEWEELECKLNPEYKETQPLSQVPIDMPEFDYWKLSEQWNWKWDINTWTTLKIWEQVERITKYLRENK